MRNTYYGDLQGRFEGTGWPLFAARRPDVVSGGRAVRRPARWRRSAPSTGTRSSKTGAAATTCSARSRQRAWATRSAMRWRPLIWLALSIAILYPDLPGHGAALVGVGAALRRRGGDVAAAHRAGLRRLCPLPRLRRSCSRWPGGVVAGRHRSMRSRSLLEQEDHSTLSEIIATVALVGRLCGRGARLFDHLSGDGEARPVAAASWNRSTSRASPCSSGSRAAGEPSSPVGEGLADALDVGGL